MVQQWLIQMPWSSAMRFQKTFLDSRYLLILRWGPVVAQVSMDIEYLWSPICPFLVGRVQPILKATMGSWAVATTLTQPQRVLLVMRVVQSDFENNRDTYPCFILMLTSPIDSVLALILIWLPRVRVLASITTSTTDNNLLLDQKMIY